MKHRIHRGHRQRIKAAEVNRWNKLVQRDQVGALVPSLPTPREYDRSSRIIAVKNTSGTDRQMGEIAKLGALLWDLEVAGTSGVCWEIATIAADSMAVVLLEPIANGAFGRAIVDGLALALVSGGTGSFAEPDIANNRLKPAASGTIKLLQTPHASEVKLLPVLLGAGSRESILIKTPAGGIPAATGSGPYTWGSATCKVVTDAGVVTAADVVIKNIVNKAIAANVQGKADPVGSIYIVDVASCGS